MKLIIFYTYTLLFFSPLLAMEKTVKTQMKTEIQEQIEESETISLNDSSETEESAEKLKKQERLEHTHFLGSLTTCSQNRGTTRDLHEAIFLNRMNTLKTMLTSKNCVINAQDDLGWTPLIVAIYMKNIEAISLLLQDPRVDIMKKDKSGKNAQKWALRMNLSDVAKELFTRILTKPAYYYHNAHY